MLSRASETSRQISDLRVALAALKHEAGRTASEDAQRLVDRRTEDLERQIAALDRRLTGLDRDLAKTAETAVHTRYRRTLRWGSVLLGLVLLTGYGELRHMSDCAALRMSHRLIMGEFPAACEGSADTIETGIWGSMLGAVGGAVEGIAGRIFYLTQTAEHSFENHFTDRAHADAPAMMARFEQAFEDWEDDTVAEFRATHRRALRIGQLATFAAADMAAAEEAEIAAVRDLTRALADDFAGMTEEEQLQYRLVAYNVLAGLFAGAQFVEVLDLNADLFERPAVRDAILDDTAARHMELFCHAAFGWMATDPDAAFDRRSIPRTLDQGGDFVAGIDVCRLLGAAVDRHDVIGGWLPAAEREAMLIGLLGEAGALAPDLPAFARRYLAEVFLRTDRKDSDAFNEDLHIFRNAMWALFEGEVGSVADVMWVLPDRDPLLPRDYPQLDEAPPAELRIWNQQDPGPR